MKIIKQGIPKQLSIWSGECVDCHSIIEAEERELLAIQYERIPDPDIGKARCPVCGKIMCFYEKK